MHPAPDQILIKLLDPAHKIHYLAESLMAGDFGELNAGDMDMRDDIDSIAVHAASLVELFDTYRTVPEETIWLMQEFEVRTILHGIYGWSEVLMMGLVGDITLEQYEVYTSIKTETGYLLNQINNLLDYERYLGNEPVLFPVWQDQTLEELFPAGEQYYRNKIHMETTHSGDLTVKFAFMRELDAALNFMLDNIIRHSKAGQILLEIHNTGEQLQILLEDDGTGILLADHPEQVLQPFFQVDTGVRGLGLGLHLAQLHIQSQGGTLALKSSPGTGTQFKIELPLKHDA